jgi:hypothetical protein
MCGAWTRENSWLVANTLAGGQPLDNGGSQEPGTWTLQFDGKGGLWLASRLTAHMLGKTKWFFIGRWDGEAFTPSSRSELLGYSETPPAPRCTAWGAQEAQRYSRHELPWEKVVLSSGHRFVAAQRPLHTVLGVTGESRVELFPLDGTEVVRAVSVAHGSLRDVVDTPAGPVALLEREKAEKGTSERGTSEWGLRYLESEQERAWTSRRGRQTVAIAPRAGIVTWVRMDGTLEARRLVDWQPAVTPPQAQEVEAVAISPGGERIAWSDHDQQVSVGERSSGAVVTLRRSSERPMELAFVRDGDWLAVRSAGSVELWNVANQDSLRPFIVSSGRASRSASTGHAAERRGAEIVQEYASFSPSAYPVSPPALSEFEDTLLLRTGASIQKWRFGPQGWTLLVERAVEGRPLAFTALGRGGALIFEGAGGTVLKAGAGDAAFEIVFPSPVGRLRALEPIADGRCILAVGDGGLALLNLSNARVLYLDSIESSDSLEIEAAAYTADGERYAGTPNIIARMAARLSPPLTSRPGLLPAPSVTIGRLISEFLNDATR